MTLRKVMAGFTAITVALGLLSIPPAMAHNHEKVPTSAGKANQAEERVFFNTHSFKYHKPNCEWAQRCTRNCVSMPKSQAIRQGGIPCRVCGG